MIRHVVMWRFKEFSEGKSKVENMEIVRERLYALMPIIHEIKRIKETVPPNETAANGSVPNRPTIILSASWVMIWPTCDKMMGTARRSVVPYSLFRRNNFNIARKDTSYW